MIRIRARELLTDVMQDHWQKYGWERIEGWAKRGMETKQRLEADTTLLFANSEEDRRRKGLPGSVTPTRSLVPDRLPTTIP